MPLPPCSRQQAARLALERRRAPGDQRRRPRAFVEPDRTLVSGDVVQNKTMPNIFGDGGTPATWLAVLDKIEGLNAAHVLPDHSAPGDGSMVGAERELISGIRTRALALKQQGVSADDAGKTMSSELKAQHPDSIVSLTEASVLITMRKANAATYCLSLHSALGALNPPPPLRLNGH